ncbi:MAG: hypothetical protein EBZ21_02035 [Flavobacteriia bacterium]|nr:hypothetical protein [Flavobacteriia bacterium]
MKRLFGIVLSAFLLACSNPQEEAERLIDAMGETAQAGGDVVVDTSGWQQKWTVLQAAANSTDQDSLWARYQMISADIQASVPGGALYAIRTYFQVADSLPSRQEGALALFSAAVTFEEKLSDRGRAIQVLTMLVDRYPGTHMAETALAYRDVLVFENDESLLDKIHEWQTQESPPTP